MSHQSLTADLCRAARRARGKQANLTYKAREQALARFSRFLWESGYQIHITKQLREKHLRAWRADMAERDLSKRTVANNLAHIRTALEGIKRRHFADKMSNAALGASGSSRKGTKAPLPETDLTNFLLEALAADRGVAMVLELQHQFGLRAAEAVCSVTSLADWHRALSNPIGDGFITVVHGTKGGKTRRSPPLDQHRAVQLVAQAMALCAEQSGKLVRKATFKDAMSRYHYVVRKIGMKGEQAPHSLRYSYATEHLRRMKATGVSRHQAAAGVSTWLGHGDGRGTWVMLVYGQSALGSGEDQNA
ncbi:integrase domain-containing protein [Ralstonia pickettii]|uniref:integrase domain-containing protein n=1 Tax=Ralstonia pickettii TaxID=329 RepID=UPI0015BF0A5B|nr:integrase domain-containing protein [Ralstonia pickettii]NWK42873.1 integrase domain-containing protein [Ralstonia pickettii]